MLDTLSFDLDSVDRLLGGVSVHFLADKKSFPCVIRWGGQSLNVANLFSHTLTRHLPINLYKLVLDQSRDIATTQFLLLYALQRLFKGRNFMAHLSESFIFFIFF